MNQAPSSVIYEMRPEHSSALAERTRLRTLLKIWLVLAVVANLLVTWYITQERVLYSWDERVYWGKTQQITLRVEEMLGIRQEELRSGSDRGPADPQASAAEPGRSAALRRDNSPTRALMSLMESIWHDDYNEVPVIILVPWSLVFGTGRLSYILGILNLYGLPTILLLMLLVDRLAAGATSLRARSWLSGTAVAVALGVCTLFWIPVLGGMVDIGGLGINLLALLCYLARPARQQRWTMLVLIGLLLAASVLFRRYNLYWVVAFLTVVAGDTAFAALRERRLGARAMLDACRPLLVIGATAALALSIIALPFLLRTFRTDYADIYDAYQRFDTVGERLEDLRARLGGVFLVWSSISVAGLLFVRELRRPTVMMALIATIVFFHFNNTQSFGKHHLYMIELTLIALSALFLVVLVARLQRATFQAGTLGLAGAWAVISLVTTFTVTGADLHATFQPWSLPSPYPPRARNDVAEMNRLFAALDEELATSPNARFYVMSATLLLNDTLFLNGSTVPPFAFRSSSRILRSHLVDKKDGFPRRLLDADLVVWADPSGTRLMREEFAVQRLPARDLGAGTGLGAAFERIAGPFRLDHGTEAWMYRRLRPFTPAEIAAFSDELRALYPDRPFIYDPAFRP